MPFGDPKELEKTRDHIRDVLEKAIDKCPKSGTNDLPIDDAALQAACIFDYLTRAIDDKGEKLPRELIIPNMLPG